MKVLLFGEPLIRITPANYNKIGNMVLSRMYYGGSEINIARNLQGFNIQTKVLTAVPDNPIGDSFISFMNQSHIDTSSVYKLGNRLGIYYLEDGFGLRQSEVYYDRTHTSINELNIEHLKMDSLFKDITHFHFSGISIAISKHVRQLLLVLLEEAKQRHITISIDLNLRTKMISVHDAKLEFSKFAKYADYCFGIDPIMADEKNFDMFDRDHATVNQIKDRMYSLKQAYHFQAIFHTIRSTDENGNNKYQAFGLKDTFEISSIMKTPVLQRVGSGDAFVAGALFKMINNTPLKDTLDFAVASGTYKCTIEGDNMYESSDKIENIISNRKDIIR